MEIPDQEIKEKLIRAQLKCDLMEEFDGSIDDRVERYLSVFQWKFTPYTHFAQISAECRLLYRDGYFFACIALCQSVAEALSRFLCKKVSVGAEGKHINRVKKLVKNNIISNESEASFARIREHRDDYHHLNPETPTGREKLKEIAFRALKGLSYIENEVFAFSIKDGVLIPKYADLWGPETIEAIQMSNRRSTDIKNNKSERR